MPVIEQTGVCQGVAAECPMDGMWTQWDNWSTCPVTCGSSSQSRMRICTDPTAGGQDCPGSSQESRPCNQAACPNPTFPPGRRGNRRRGGRRRRNRNRGRRRGCRATALRRACRSARRG
ncbi:ectin-like [Watersipora subatra]|uniref:ectin-like n=1 Tax=Watersipora subatra TaxID=2589382 RepID=UPI00355B95D9